MTQTITAMYDDQAQAQAALSKLVAAGIPQSAIRLTPGSSNTTNRSTGSYDHTRDEGGFWSSLKDLFVPEEDRYSYSEGLRRGGTLLSASVDEGKVHTAMDILEEHGSVDLDEREATWRKEGWGGYSGGTTSSAGMTSGSTGTAGTGSTTTNPNMLGGAEAAGGIPVTGEATGAGTGTGAADLRTSSMGGAEAAGGIPVTGEAVGAGTRTGAADLRTSGMGGTASASEAAGTHSAGMSGNETIPIVEERLNVGKRVTDHGRVRVRSYAVERPVEEQVNLRQETVQVERRPVDRAPTEGDEALFAERTIEAVEHNEEAVVSKEARVVEEVGLRKEGSQRTETVSDTVRRTEVEVEDERGNVSRTGTTETPDRTR